MNTVNGRSSVYHGTVQFPDAALPEITANMISYDSVDIAYPSIASAGNKVYGRQSLITFSHSGENIFPGTSVVYYDNSGNYSDLLMVKKGQGIINSFIADTSERWGDYTSIQRRDKNPNEFWITGSYGKNTNAVGTWISKISINDPSVGIQAVSEKPIQDLDAYPNPVADVLTLPFIINADAMVQIQVYDQSGKLMLSLSENQNTGQQKAFINTSEFASGIYFYTITANAQLISNGSFSK
jgi:hypothetical protein